MPLYRLVTPILGVYYAMYSAVVWYGGEVFKQIEVEVSPLVGRGRICSSISKAVG